MNIMTKALLGTGAAAAALVSTASPALARDRGGIDIGDIIAGAVVLGGIAAVAGAIGNNRGYGYDYPSGSYRYNDRYGYNDRYDRYGYNYRIGNPRQAVEQCVRAAQRGAYGARVTDIRDVDRKNYGYRVKGTVVVNERGGGWGRDYNYRYSGRNYDQGRFTCDVQGNRVVGLDYSGLRGYR